MSGHCHVCGAEGPDVVATPSGGGERVPATPPTPLAQMSPDALYKMFWADHRPDLGDFLHALIQRATREAREGYVSRESVSARNLEFIIEQRDEARAQLAEAHGRLRTVCQRLVEVVGADGPCDVEGAAERIIHRLAEAERKLASAGRDALTKLAETLTYHATVKSSHLAHRLDIENFRDQHYPAPTPAASVDEPRLLQGVDGEPDACTYCGPIPRNHSFSHHCDLHHPAASGTPIPEPTPVAYGLEDDFGNIHVARAGRHPAEDAQRQLAALGLATRIVPLCRVALAREAR